MVLAELGHCSDAVVALERAIESAPRRVHPYFNLTLFKQMKPGDRHIAAMEELTQDMSSLAENDQIYLNFAMGKAFADIEDHGRSFQCLLNGNALRRKQILYAESSSLALLERTRTVFSSEHMRSKVDCGEPSKLPVFIVGMPRSGTTLIEQILHSHHKVFGVGEIHDFQKSISALGFASGAPRFPDAASRMSAAQLRRLGAHYVSLIKSAAPTAERIVNKMLENFRFVGLINLALPQARIIHVRRNPIDTCLSCFSHLFVDGFPYVYDLGELGRYYRAYEGLMAHWRGVLPQNVMLELQYEDVIADLEGQSRRIVAHCGLEWDARCLDFYQTERQVRTASLTQVRQPIYKNSVGRWRAYERFLGSLLAEFEPSIIGEVRAA